MFRLFSSKGTTKIYINVVPQQQESTLDINSIQCKTNIPLLCIWNSLRNWNFDEFLREVTCIEKIKYNQIKITTKIIAPSKYTYLLFAQFAIWGGEPQSWAQIYVHCSAYTVRHILNCAPISLNTLHASGTGELKQWIHSPDQGSTCKWQIMQRLNSYKLYHGLVHILPCYSRALWFWRQHVFIMLR